jgi:hypothetical protein
MVLLLNYLDYVVSVLERVECILATLAFLKCELIETTRREFRQQLQAYPQLLQAVMAMPIDWNARDSFLSRTDYEVNEALLWAYGGKTAHDSARQYWLKFLESLESIL